jgi:hypothetical protein
MADGVNDQQPVARSTDEHAVGTALPKSSARSRRRMRRAASSPHSHRFRTATALLIGFGIGALLIAIVVAVSSGGQSKPSAPWSSWAPTDGGTQGAREIADYVAPLYRLSSVDQLAVVTVVNLESTAQANAAAEAAANGESTSSSGLQVAVQSNPDSSAVSLLGGNTIAYNLCGIGGKNCAIGIGTPSTNRLLLLRREALELALYTFKYVGGVDNVVAILPPGYTQETSVLTKRLPTSDSGGTKSIDIAVLFVKPELAPLLKQPLSATLPEEFPPTVAQMAKAPEAGLVDQITAHGLFSEQLQTAQDGSNLIVLDPLPPQ